jgi:ArsR family transcriptional regulator
MEHIYRTDPESFIELAEILKVLAHPQRLCIVKTLCERDQLNVGDMQHCLDEAQSTVSQHLSKLKAANIIIGKREGTNIYYSICNERVRVLVQSVCNDFFFEEK